MFLAVKMTEPSSPFLSYNSNCNAFFYRGRICVSLETRDKGKSVREGWALCALVINDDFMLVGKMKPKQNKSNGQVKKK